jgi:hypothetical protein
MLLLSASIVPAIELLKFFQRLFSRAEEPPSAPRGAAAKG